VIVAGAPNTTIGSQDFQGSAYVFTMPAGGGWATSSSPSAELINAPGQAYDRLGWSVAIAGQIIAVGAPQNLGSHTGYAGVFTTPVGGWDGFMSSPALLTASESNGELGISVAVSGATVFAGAWNNVNTVYAYTQSSTGGWIDQPVPTATLTAAAGGGNPAAGGLGFSLAAQGGVLVAGAPDTTVGGQASAGAVYVFTEQGTSWATTSTPAVVLTAQSPQASQFLGWSVAISGSTIVAVTEASPNSAQLFAEPAAGWATETASTELTPLNTSYSAGPGMSAAMSGSTVVVGDPGARAFTGAAYVFGPPPTGQPPWPLITSGMAAPRSGSTLRAGRLVTVSTAVDYQGGGPVPAALAAGISAGCYLTIRAAGAQSLRTRCLRYDRANGLFSYRWRLGPRTGRVRVGLTLSYRSSGVTQWYRLRISRS
jgi:FG-GAP repeat